MRGYGGLWQRVWPVDGVPAPPSTLPPRGGGEEQRAACPPSSRKDVVSITLMQGAWQAHDKDPPRFSARDDLAHLTGIVERQGTRERTSQRRDAATPCVGWYSVTLPCRDAILVTYKQASWPVEGELQSNMSALLALRQLMIKIRLLSLSATTSPISLVLLNGKGQGNVLANGGCATPSVRFLAVTPY